MEFAEFMMRIVILVSLIFGVLGMIVQSASFEGSILAHKSKISSIDMANALASASCLIADSKVGVLKEQSLDEYSKKELCIRFDEKWSAEIKSEDKVWTFGMKESDLENPSSYEMPVVVQTATGFAPGKVMVKVSQ